VDISQALKLTEVKPPDRPSAPHPPPPEGSLSALVPGKASFVLKDRPGASGEQIRKRIHDAQEQARKDILSRLRRFYGTEVARFELDQDKARTAAELEAYESAGARIRQRFEAYAERRAPVYTRLTLLAGFPDPNPASRPPDNPLPPALQKRFDEAASLRAELAAIDRAFREDVDVILSSVQDLVAAQLTAARLRIEQFKEELDRRAAQEASEQVRETTQELGLQLIEPRDQTIPGTTPSKVTITGGPAFRAAPAVPSQGILAGDADRERLLRHELGIWLSLNRYRQGGKGDADLTSEFLKWRSQFEVGH
jgi:hypothetical protein